MLRLLSRSLLRSVAPKQVSLAVRNVKKSFHTTVPVFGPGRDRAIQQELESEDKDETVVMRELKPPDVPRGYELIESPDSPIVKLQNRGRDETVTILFEPQRMTMKEDVDLDEDEEEEEEAPQQPKRAGGGFLSRILDDAKAAYKEGQEARGGRRGSPAAEVDSEPVENSKDDDSRDSILADHWVDHNGVDFCVFVERTQAKDGLLFSIAYDDGKMNVEHLFCRNVATPHTELIRADPKRIGYVPPEFADLSEPLQGKLIAYLEDVGIDQEICRYIARMAHIKEQKEYMLYLRKLRNFYSQN